MLKSFADRYAATAEDAAYAILKLHPDVVAQVNASWVTRVRRDDLLTLHVDGTDGSAVAGLRECRVQSRQETPKAIWNPDIPQPIDFYAGWRTVDGGAEYDNAFKVQWELFLRHVALGEPFAWDFLQGARGAWFEPL